MAGTRAGRGDVWYTMVRKRRIERVDVASTSERRGDAGSSRMRRAERADGASKGRGADDGGDGV